MPDLTIADSYVLAIGLTLAWLAGLRVYLTVFGIGLAGAMGWLHLPPALQVAAAPWIIALSGLMALVEFCVDKIPGVDSGWDLIHTLLRLPAGAFLAAATLSPDGHLGTMPLLAGGSLALASHALKTGTRVLINTSPEPLSNWTASLGEDAYVLTALVLVISHPWLAWLALGLAVASGLLVAAAILWLFRAVLRGSGRPHREAWA